jgi:hypothetical protein
MPAAVVLQPSNDKLSCDAALSAVFLFPWGTTPRLSPCVKRAYFAQNQKCSSLSSHTDGAFANLWPQMIFPKNVQDPTNPNYTHGSRTPPIKGRRSETRNFPSPDISKCQPLRGCHARRIPHRVDSVSNWTHLVRSGFLAGANGSTTERLVQSSADAGWELSTKKSAELE